jgi:CDP-diacylglycerol--glycerol-3-phosphate 3-phosphatidyltransferase
MKKLNLPNQLTLFRICLVPVMTIIMYLDVLLIPLNFFGMTVQQLVILILFILGSISDFLDGYLARKYNLITTFGKFLDPIADKLLTITAFLYLVKLGQVEVWILVLILLREFMISGMRLVLAEKKVVLPAQWSGKIKTTTTMLTLIFLLPNEFNLPIYSLGSLFNNSIPGIILLSLTVLLTLYSGIEYFVNCAKTLRQEPIL